MGLDRRRHARLYPFGLALTVGPSLEDGVPLHRAFRDAVYSETASIVAMKAAALTVGSSLWGDAGLHDTRFWSAIAVS